VRVTHPFHPLAGQELEFVKRRKNWRLDRVYFYNEAGELATLPAEWTDVVTPDPFVVMSAGRSPFRATAVLPPRPKISAAVPRSHTPLHLVHVRQHHVE
jgi:hypothetical protein